MEKAIELKNVAKHYIMGENIVKALDGIDIVINKGEFVALIGPSGSGKSTAMNLVGSLDRQTKGAIFLDKRDTSHFRESELAQVRGRKIGFIFQSFNLIQNLTAKENVMLPMLFQEVDKYEREERASKLMNLVDLGARMDHYPNQLSGGQQQRVAIARALANDPEIILADEPTGNLDTKTGEKVMGFLKELNKKGKTIILITHDNKLAEQADVVYYIVDGKIKDIRKRIKGKLKKFK